jgi:hypothetical protein
MLSATDCLPHQVELAEERKQRQLAADERNAQAQQLAEEDLEAERRRAEWRTSHAESKRAALRATARAKAEAHARGARAAAAAASQPACPPPMTITSKERSILTLCFKPLPNRGCFT